MSGAYAGIDCGSAACKGVLLHDGIIVRTLVLPTGESPKQTALRVHTELTAGAEQNIPTVATGYGRVGMDFADRTVTEITCHAAGAEYILPGVRTVIDIGGQDSKAISLASGKVLSFQMNDKCAAGTGRFLEMSAQRLGVTLDELPKLLAAGESCALSSMCAVFADSEIVSLLAAGTTREQIVGGIVRSIAERATALAARIEIIGPVLLTGGLADLESLRTELEIRTGQPVFSSPMSRYAGALGAAVIAAGM